VHGRVWVELKVLAAHGLTSKMAELEKDLASKFQEVCLIDKSFSGILLLVAAVEKEAGSQWATPVLKSRLLAAGCSAGFSSLSQGNKVAPGHAKADSKLTFAEIWTQMEWHQDKGQAVGSFKHFLEALGLPGGNPGTRAGSLNKKMAQHHMKGRLRQIKVKTRAGRPLWVATKGVFRSLRKLL
jgi:hypothetical protein